MERERIYASGVTIWCNNGLKTLTIDKSRVYLIKPRASSFVTNPANRADRWYGKLIYLKLVNDGVVSAARRWTRVWEWVRSLKCHPRTSDRGSTSENQILEKCEALVRRADFRSRHFRRRERKLFRPL